MKTPPFLRSQIAKKPSCCHKRPTSRMGSRRVLPPQVLLNFSFFKFLFTQKLQLCKVQNPGDMQLYWDLHCSIPLQNGSPLMTPIHSCSEPTNEVRHNVHLPPSAAATSAHDVGWRRGRPVLQAVKLRESNRDVLKIVTKKVWLEWWEEG